MNKEEREFEQMENGIQEMLLSWVEHRNWTERVLMKNVTRFFLGRKLFKDLLNLHAEACGGVKSCLKSVDNLKKMRRLRYRGFVIDRILRRRKVIQAQKRLEDFPEGV